MTAEDLSNIIAETIDNVDLDKLKNEKSWIVKAIIISDVVRRLMVHD